MRYCLPPLWSLKVQDPVAEGCVQSQVPELSDELGGHYGVELLEQSLTDDL